MAAALQIFLLYNDIMQIFNTKPTKASIALILQKNLKNEINNLKKDKKNTILLLNNMYYEYLNYIKINNIEKDDNIIKKIKTLIKQLNELKFNILDEDIINFQLYIKQFQDLQKDINKIYGINFQFWKMDYFSDITLRKFMFLILFLVSISYQSFYNNENWSSIIISTIVLFSDFCKIIFTYDDLKEGQYLKAFSPWIFKISSYFSIFVDTIFPSIIKKYENSEAIKYMLEVLYNYILKPLFSLSYLQDQLNKNKLYNYSFYSNTKESESEKKSTALSILGVSERASNKQIQKAFREKSKIYHDDKCKLPECKAKFEQIKYLYDLTRIQNKDGSINLSKILKKIVKNINY